MALIHLFAVASIRINGSSSAFSGEEKVVPGWVLGSVTQLSAAITQSRDGGLVLWGRVPHL